MSWRNSTPASSRIHTDMWIERDFQNSWLIRDDFYLSQITAPEGADAEEESSEPKEDTSMDARPLREKNFRKNSKYVHVPHKDKPPQVVAKRNARERRRVQAVNSAFVRLRKAVPIDNSRGKRVSKVKTLQHAIEYIHQLEELLRKHGSYEQLNVMPTYCHSQYDGFPNAIEFEDEAEF